MPWGVYWRNDIFLVYRCFNFGLFKQKSFSKSGFQKNVLLPGKIVRKKLVLRAIAHVNHYSPGFCFLAIMQPFIYA